jgi:hypothetical protein
MEAAARSKKAPAAAPVYPTAAPAGPKRSVLDDRN